MKAYDWPKDWSQVGKDIKQVLNVSMFEIYDPLASYAMQKFMIDITKFDNILHRRFGNYEEKNQSMKDIIKEHYGISGVELIKQLL